MGLISGLYAGREALLTHQSALGSVADNISNLNTPGFKPGRVEFGDLFAESIGSLYGSPVATGNGVRAESVSVAHHLQGTVEATGRPLDAALDGGGFFVTSNGTDNFYTRAGNFFTDAEGNLVSADGKSVMGFPVATPDALTPLTTAGITGAATATTAVALTGNLDAGAAPIAAIPANPASFIELNQSTSFRTTVTVIDSLGEGHDLSLHFFKGAEAGSWTVQAYTTGDEVNGGTPGAPVQVGTAALAFGPDGLQAEGAESQLAVTAPWANGAEAGNLAIDLAGFTGYAGFSALQSVIADGNRAGTVTGYSFGDDGTFFAELSNGEEVAIGKLAVASFNAPNGLQRAGDNNFTETAESGAPNIGLAGEDGRGGIKGGSIENSSVDAANEFIDLIRFQRAYQAGTQVINTLSEVVNTTIQIL